MTELIVKVSVAGEGGTGKTSMLHRLVSGQFIADMKMTIGTGLMTYKESSEDHEIIYQLWDFAGEKRFRFFLPNYLKGSKAVLLCYDTSRFITFQNLNEWYSIIEKNVDMNDTIIYLVGTKKDLSDRKAVLSETLDSWLKDKKIDRIFECSALSGENIDVIFSELAKDIINKN